MSYSVLVNLVGFVAGVAAYFGWAKYGQPWLRRKQSYKKRVATRRARKANVKGGANEKNDG